MRRALLRHRVDRPPTQANFTSTMGRRLAEHLDVPPRELPERLGNHLVRVDLDCPPRLSDDGRIAHDWWGAGWSTETEGYWPADAPLGARTDLDRFPWPDPQDPRLMEEAAAVIRSDQGRHFVVPNLGICLFERAWSLRGFDQFLMDMVDRPEWAEELLERITDIQVQLARRFVGLGVDGGYLGDDYGAQKRLLFSPTLWRRMLKPRLARLFAVFREAGLPVIFHSDGDIWAILPDLVEIGMTCLNPAQPEVLDHGRLQREWGGRLAFYGGISTQSVLPRGTPEEVRAATRACLAALAPEGTGLVIGPSHRMQSDIPVENVVAMLEALPR